MFLSVLPFRVKILVCIVAVLLKYMKVPHE